MGSVPFIHRSAGKKLLPNSGIGIVSPNSGVHLLCVANIKQEC